MKYSCQQRKPTLLWGTPLFGRIYFKNIIHVIHKAETMIGKKCWSLTSSWFHCVVLAIQSHLSEVYIHLQQVVPKIIPRCLPDPILSITLGVSLYSDDGLESLLQGKTLWFNNVSSPLYSNNSDRNFFYKASLKYPVPAEGSVPRYSHAAGKREIGITRVCFPPASKNGHVCISKADPKTSDQWQTVNLNSYR